MAVTSRLIGAIMRAGLVMAMATLPAALLIEVSADTQQMVTFAAILLGIITFAEYQAIFPSLIEFRDAAPYNRMRFGMLVSSLAALSLAHPATILPIDVQIQLTTLANHVGAAMDFPFSPAWLMAQAAPQGQGMVQDDYLRNAAGLAYLISLTWLAVAALMVRIGGWPSPKRPLNLWVNLPMFDPTAGLDVVYRLSRDGRLNILLGFALPFVLPVVAKLILDGAPTQQVLTLHSVIWITALWAFVPASLILRGIALLRIAELIVQSRAAYGAGQVKALATA